jgi:hypothetical protein
MNFEQLADDERPNRMAAYFPGPTLCAVSRRLETRTANLSVEREEIERLQHYFDAYEPVEYDQLADVFAYRFFLTNFWKTALALEMRNQTSQTRSSTWVAAPGLRSSPPSPGCAIGPIDRIGFWRF